MRTILIIDDDVAFMAKLKEQLQEAGYRVLTSNILQSAEHTCVREQPDLVLLEVRTEQGAGWDALPRLAALQPVIVLSKAGLEEDVMRAFAAGATDYVAKPYRTGELLARIQARMLPEAPVLTPPQPKIDTEGATQTMSQPTRRRSADEESESVFMSEAEELALLRSTEGTADIRQLTESEEQASFGQRLRAERQRRHLTLVQVENEIKVRMYYLQAIEDEQWSLLPRGPAAVRMMRAYASFFGIDSSAAEAEYRKRYQVDEKSPSFSFTVGNVNTRVLRRTPPRWLIVVLAIVLALAIAGGAIYLFDPMFFSRILGG
ncbi:MAG TPA: response regulator receiver protein [Chloroflexus aurantiacus]|jgi:DNA-binding response OmpR family regulator|uniref:Response regulator receiver n=1 Tax=Chloroflexus aurantiacus (strain ATCC 29366 / DSM 635 / J-10-fl) TaxID=324602 RepID=A9WKL8_CHLAA|nr:MULTISPECIES: response regulator [Chloroflexus]ABY36646.1 response regulator receiver [Chloroflexus aurantiacus J-10-fl]HBW67702.1 response regulator receiver protein [Chloroflexus aurantiacus]